MTIGDQLKRLRIEKGYEQQNICNALGIEQCTLSNYENDRRLPNSDMLLKMADFFNVSTDVLLGRVIADEKPAKTIGGRIQKYRKDRGMTQQDLAEKTNQSRSHIASIERDYYKPSPELLERIASVLSVDTELLIPKEWEEKEEASNALGDFIRNYRGEHDLSLRDFAKKADISHTHIDSIEKGINFRTGKPVKVTAETIKKLAKAMNVDEDYIFQLSIGKETNSPARKLNKKDKIEIDDYINKFEKELMEQTSLMLDGEPLTQESREKLIAAVRIGAEMAKREAKEKYTPKKYRQKG